MLKVGMPLEHKMGVVQGAGAAQRLLRRKIMRLPTLALFPIKKI